MTTKLVSPQEYSSLSDEQQIDVLALLFERCPTLTTLVKPVVLKTLEQTPESTWPTVIEAVRARLREFLATSPNDPCVSAIIAAHPRLGAIKVDSQASQSEQQSLSGIGEQLRAMNERYEQAFPGLRYVVFVNGRPREEILPEMEARIQRNDMEAEKLAAFEAMCDIALDRCSKAE